MAVTGAIALSTSSTKTGRPVTVTCTLTNGGSGTVQLTGITPSVAIAVGESISPMPHAAMVLGQPPLGGAFPMSIAGSGGTLKVSWTAVPNAPTSSYGLAEPSTWDYRMGAAFTASDGTATTASASTLTVGYAGN